MTSTRLDTAKTEAEMRAAVERHWTVSDASDEAGEYAIYAEGVLIPVKHLINGESIRQMAASEVTYFHIELSEHAVIFAEGMTAESYLETGDRTSFANGAPATALHPLWGSEARDVGMIFEALGAAPLRITGPEVARVRALLAERQRNLAA